MPAQPHAASSAARPSGGIPRLRPVSVPLLSYGFRPFFLGAALWACVAMVLWVGLLSGLVQFAADYGGVAWHAHEFLFGYVSAVMTGFLLTAIPNWTGRLPLQGRPLAGLVTLWLCGRAAMLMSDRIGIVPAALIDSSYLFILTAAVLREIVTGRNWRNLKVVGLTGLVALANVAFHVEAILSGAPALGIRIGTGAIVGLIVLIGGRITPSFTSSWLSRQGDTTRPRPLGRFDMLSIAVMALALIAWVAAPQEDYSGFALIAAGVLQAIRLFRWAGVRTWSEPIVFILHVGYAFVPLGAFMLALSILWPDLLPQTGALHAWTTGAIGVMTLAVMTRATRGHTGRAIVSDAATNLIYTAILAAVAARVTAAFLPEYSNGLLYASAASWLVAFGTFVGSYGPMLIKVRQSDRQGC